MKYGVYGLARYVHIVIHRTNKQEKIMAIKKIESIESASGIASIYHHQGKNKYQVLGKFDSSQEWVNVGMFNSYDQAIDNSIAFLSS